VRAERAPARREEEAITARSHPRAPRPPIPTVGFAPSALRVFTRARPARVSRRVRLGGRWFLAGLLASSPAPREGAAQTVVQPAGENLRAAPSGEIIGVVRGDTRVAVVAREGRWRQVDLEGWIWALSVGPTGAGSLQVDAAGGENLRAEPNGPILARLSMGTVLEETQRRGRWVRVRRRAWLWAPSLRDARPPPAAASPGDASPSNEAPPEEPGAGRAPARLAIPRDGVVMRVQPDSTEVATLRAGVSVEVLERRGGWARVRTEGWIPVADTTAAEAEAPLTGVTVMELGEHPERYQGKRLAWPVQFISLERAERIRTEFYEGEPFLLARGPGQGRPIVYLAVPPELLARVERLEPLDRLEVVGRVRTPRSPLTGAPVLDLQEIR